MQKYFWLWFSMKSMSCQHLFRSGGGWCIPCSPPCVRAWLRTSASIVCWGLEFLELLISTFCYINKTETRTDLCEVHIISIIIPIWFLLYSCNRPDCRIECFAGPGYPRGWGTLICGAGAETRTAMRAGTGRMQEKKFFVVVIECWAKVHELNQLKNRKTRGCTKVVCQHCT